jgi:hypothetical protein
MTAIDDKFDALTRRKVVFEDKVDFMNWMFEYACRTLEYERLDPKKNYKQIPKLIVIKLDNIVKMADKIYWDHPEYRYFILQTPSYNKIDYLVKQEHRI